MLSRVAAIPQAYFQLALLNIGLIASLCRDHTILYTVLSLVFVVLAGSVLASKVLGINLEQLFSAQAEERARQGTEKVKDLIGGLKESGQMGCVKALVLLYVWLNFMCPCLEVFIILNVGFAYVFLPEQFDSLLKKACNLSCGKCPYSP